MIRNYNVQFVTLENKGWVCVVLVTVTEMSKHSKPSLNMQPASPDGRLNIGTPSCCCACVFGQYCVLTCIHSFLVLKDERGGGGGGGGVYYQPTFTPTLWSLHF